jgi:hypothetical protein
MKTKRRLPDKDIIAKFRITNRSDLVRHLQTVATEAQQLNGDAATILALRSDIVAIARQITIYVDAQDPKARDAANERRDAIRFKRKAALFRMVFSGSSMAEVTEKFAVQSEVIRRHISDIAKTLQMRSRMAARKAPQQDLLASIPISFPMRLTDEERKTYLSYLERYEIELDRRENGLPWKDVWRENGAEPSKAPPA